MASDTIPGGWFDLQVNGFAGVDFQQTGLTLAEMEHVVSVLHSHGTSRILLTLITDRIEGLVVKLAEMEILRQRSRVLAKTVVGYHLEGPYLRPEPGFHGAHPPALMKAPEIPEFERMWAASGENIRLITLAPEWPGSPEFIRHVVARGIRVAIGHSDASDPEIDAAQAAGLTLCTHLGNGVPMQLDRHHNIVQRLLARDELFATFIPDGLHLPPGVLKNFVRAKPRDRVLFTTDAMSAAGAPPGRHRIGTLEVEVGADGVVRQPGKPNFAGSSLTMDQAAVRAERFLGWSPADVRAACSGRVAAYLGFPAA